MLCCTGFNYLMRKLIVNSVICDILYMVMVLDRYYIQVEAVLYSFIIDKIAFLINSNDVWSVDKYVDTVSIILVVAGQHENVQQVAH